MRSSLMGRLTFFTNPFTLIYFMVLPVINTLLSIAALVIAILMWKTPI